MATVLLSKTAVLSGERLAGSGEKGEYERERNDGDHLDSECVKIATTTKVDDEGKLERQK